MTTLFTWPGHDDAVDGPQRPKHANEAFEQYSANMPGRSRAMLWAIFSALTAAQQEHVLVQLGWEKVGEASPENHPQEPTQSPPSGVVHDESDERWRAALESSHVAQWIELSTRAANFGARVWVDGSGFGIQVDGDGMWKQVATLFELRAALSDWVAHERAHGREPAPRDPLRAAIISAAERSGRYTDQENLDEAAARLSVPTDGDLLVGIVRDMGEALYQFEMEAAHRGPTPSISFVEDDGTERCIVWEAGDRSVGISEGYRSDDDLWGKRAEGKELVGVLKGVWSALGQPTTARRRGMLRDEIVRLLDEMEPNWKAKGSRS